MVRSRIPPAALAWSRAEEVEVQFYEALRLRDLERLMACFLEDDLVSCIHPGGVRLDGLAAIHAGFESMFTQGMAEIHAHEVLAWSGEGMAVHQVLERIGLPGDESGSFRWVNATNVYVLTEKGWRMVCHHASAAALPADAAGFGARSPGGAPGLLH